MIVNPTTEFLQILVEPISEPIIELRKLNGLHKRKQEPGTSRTSLHHRYPKICYTTNPKRQLSIVDSNFGRNFNRSTTKESKGEKHIRMDELQRTHTHSSSISLCRLCSDEEVKEGGERKKKKKSDNILVAQELIHTIKRKAREGYGIKETIKEKKSGDHKGEKDEYEEKNAEGETEEHKKGFLEKMKEKIPDGHHK
ncbi:dehydrin family protein [Striga asiatica]|uniref:Dehydrin family protein n=1 Tax=Striga asiatica TaxID=4170 RepID=A0A5A7RKQ7_STRAF|nr:dehydrin family protein [Striga asiatica]